MKTSSSLAALLAGIAVAGCSGNTSGTGETTGALLPGPYYNLTPGQCAEFDDDAGFGPTVGLQIMTSTAPPGIELLRTFHGSPQEIDYLTVDAGVVFLLERNLVGETGAPTQVYASPLSYLPSPPLVVGGGQLSSTSNCATGSNCTAITLTPGVADSRPYTGPLSVPDGGMTEYKINFVYTGTLADGGAISETDRAWITPGIGFTDLFLPTDNGGGYIDYKLVDIVTDGGSCAAH